MKKLSSKKIEKFASKALTTVEAKSVKGGTNQIIIQDMIDA